MRIAPSSMFIPVAATVPVAQREIVPESEPRR
jgi:hypothetical protein